ncbi:MAG TPA: hypothetical protein VGP13_02480, partial [Candidatus Paceibacterota bacterium]|nr:hypothetical protein [Candidatus Paceibacterota bacterium]
MSKSAINLYTMWGFCPLAVAKRNLHFAFRTFTASDDNEVIQLRKDFFAFLSQKVVGIQKRDGL